MINRSVTLQWLSWLPYSSLHCSTLQKEECAVHKVSTQMYTHKQTNVSVRLIMYPHAYYRSMLNTVTSVMPVPKACRHATYVHLHTVTSVRPMPVYQCRINASGTCTDRMTSCRACYFARDERPLPSQCSTALERYRCAGLTGRKRNQCLKRWGTCVKEAFKDIHGKKVGYSVVVWWYEVGCSTYV